MGSVKGASRARYRSNRNWMRNWRYSELYKDPKKGDDMFACTSVGRKASSALSARTPTNGRNSAADRVRRQLEAEVIEGTTVVPGADEVERLVYDTSTEDGEPVEQRQQPRLGRHGYARARADDGARRPGRRVQMVDADNRQSTESKNVVKAFRSARAYDRTYDALRSTSVPA